MGVCKTVMHTFPIPFCTDKFATNINGDVIGCVTGYIYAGQIFNQIQVFKDCSK